MLNPENVARNASDYDIPVYSHVCCISVLSMKINPTGSGKHLLAPVPLSIPVYT